MRTAAIQQELMDAALACGDEAREKFNTFQTSFGPELRRSDKALLDMFHRVKGFRQGEADYNLFKTDLASRAELRRLGGHEKFCALADQTVSEALAADRPTLATFVDSVAVVDTQGSIASCGLVVAEAGIVPMPKPTEIAALARPVTAAPMAAPVAAMAPPPAPAVAPPVSAAPTVVASVPAQPTVATPQAVAPPIAATTVLVPAAAPEPAPPITTRMSGVAVVVPTPNPVEVAATFRNAAIAQSRPTMTPPKNAAAVFVPSPKPQRLAALALPSPVAAPEPAQAITIVPRPKPSRLSGQSATKNVGPEK